MKCHGNEGVKQVVVQVSVEPRGQSITKVVFRENTSTHRNPMYVDLTERETIRAVRSLTDSEK